MTEPSIYYPEQLKGRQLDAFLERGWYRMFQSLFTTHFITEQDRLYRVFWLRYNILSIRFSRRLRLLMQNNSRFSHSIKPTEVNEEVEALYALYKTGIDFDPASSVQQWLFGDSQANVFDSYMVEVRDKDLLIAVGVFDKGEKSIAGIMNFYHPAYKKCSPGKYLMLLKMQYAIAHKLQWYYPGYIIYGYSKFDYKLFADKDAAEIYIPELNSWLNYAPSVMDAVERADLTGEEDISQ
ncbi:MAG TPA: hypothetical protein PKM63_01255 [Panacibacter sp.]|nr:hypothetical protein [Panacibacter sp.]HNP42881.1 hypothetical protein [Panacibacter sp.]